MSHLSRIKDEAASKGGFLTGLLVGALVVVLTWGFASAMEASHQPPERSDAATPVKNTSPTTSQRRHSDPQAGCRRVFDAQTRPLRAAAASLAQWKVHVGAMNKLVAGEITLSQATVFWNRTRAGAHRRLARYDEAVRSLAHHSGSCERRDAPATGSYVSCQKAVDARAAELRVAAVALRTWRHHVRDMDMLRSGMLSPARATRMWIANWHKGAAQLQDYDDAVIAASAARCD